MLKCSNITSEWLRLSIPLWRLDEAKTKPVPKKIFGPFWYEEELCILFADSNQGKSLLAVQIIDSFTTGIPTLGVEMELKASKVIYFELEPEINPYGHDGTIEEYKTFLFKEIESQTSKYGAKILVIDNLS